MISMLIHGWIDEQNLKPFAQCLGWFVQYQMDESDWIALEFGLRQTDSEQDRWFDYSFVGSQQLKFWLACDPNSAVILVHVEAPEVVKPKIEAAILIMQHFSIKSPL